MARMSDLPKKLVGEKILTRVPVTSLKAVRSTCKTWEAITKKCVVLGKAAAAAPHENLGFVTMNSKVYSLRYHVGEEEKDVSVSVKQVDHLVNELKVSKLYHCDGLVLCVAKDLSKLVLWNPYLCQTRLIRPRLGENKLKILDLYAIGYSKERNNHKILRFGEDYVVSGSTTVTVLRCEIYEMSSSSWRVLKAKKQQLDWEIDAHQRGVSVKGNTYFFAHQRFFDDDIPQENEGEVEDFLLCFDFTKERFGPRLPLPFHSYNEDCVTLSSFLRHGGNDDDDEHLAVLFADSDSSLFDIWVTLTVEPKYVSWSKFLRVETEPLLNNFRLSTYLGGSFFVDEENKVAVVFELDEDEDQSTFSDDPHHHTAFVFGPAGYIHSVNLGEALKLPHRSLYSGNYGHCLARLPPVVCSSSYRPSLVQVNQPLTHKRKRM